MCFVDMIDTFKECMLISLSRSHFKHFHPVEDNRHTVSQVINKAVLRR